jgi:hypothetical protein
MISTAEKIFSLSFTLCFKVIYGVWGAMNDLSQEVRGPGGEEHPQGQWNVFCSTVWTSLFLRQ